MIAERLKPGWVDPAGVTGGTPLHKLARRVLPMDARWALAERVFQARTQLRLAKDLACEIGWPAVAKLRIAQTVKPLTRTKRLCKVHLPGFTHPLYYREGTSDAFVIEQVFARHEYECVLGQPVVRTIVDLGANVGYTTHYLLHHYPFAKAVIVEPDAGNLAVCRKNLAPFGDRVTFLHAGIWSQPGPMVLERETEEWAFTAREAKPGEEPDFDAMTVEQVRAVAGFERIDILKVDIEGAERTAFADRPAWVDRVKTLVIELHGPDCERAVDSAIAHRPAARSTNGELTIYRFENQPSPAPRNA